MKDAEHSNLLNRIRSLRVRNRNLLKVLKSFIRTGVLQKFGKSQPGRRLVGIALDL
jgi:hypothetical protein